MDFYENLRILSILPLELLSQKWAQTTVQILGKKLTWVLGFDEFSITKIKLSVGKKLINVDNKEDIKDILCDITCKYSLTIFSEKQQNKRIVVGWS